MVGSPGRNMHGNAPLRPIFGSLLLIAMRLAHVVQDKMKIVTIRKICVKKTMIDVLGKQTGIIDPSMEPVLNVLCPFWRGFCSI